MGLEYIYFAIAFFIAGIAPELTGFGVATISMALLPFLLPLSVAIPLVAIISTTATGIVALRTKTKNILKYTRPLLIGSVIGVTLGMMFLHLLNEQLLMVILSIFLITYALYGLFFKGYILPTGNVTGTATGLVAGFFGASFNVHGPLVGLYSSSNDDLSKTEIKDIMATYMFFTGLFTVVGHTVAGRVTGEVLLYALFALPFLLIGLVVGKRIFKKVNIIWIKRGIYLFVLAAGVTLLF
ncbi:sulfite exporter TauE/SafE family protein [Candidatus Wolfebacteria bacterium]|nr:sulfite exporter TauE/SafE family protein [Candidatus Wolfebacteria bacterium]